MLGGIFWVNAVSQSVLTLVFLVLMAYGRVSARDSGKTMVDAALGEIITTCEKIDWLLKEGERWLKPEYRLVPVLDCHAPSSFGW